MNVSKSVKLDSGRPVDVSMQSLCSAGGGSLRMSASAMAGGPPWISAWARASSTTDWRLRVQRATAGETGGLQNPQATGSKTRTQCAVSCSARAKDSVQRPQPPLRRDRAGPRPPPSLPSPSSPELPPSPALPKEPIMESHDAPRPAAGAPPSGAASHARGGAGPRTAESNPASTSQRALAPSLSPASSGRAKSRA